MRLTLLILMTLTFIVSGIFSGCQQHGAPGGQVTTAPRQAGTSTSQAPDRGQRGRGGEEVGSPGGQTAGAGQGGQISGGGVLEGRIRVSAPPHAPEPVRVAKDQATCGKQLPQEQLLLDPKKGVANVIVYLDEVKGNSSPPPLLTLDNRGCSFTPRIQVGAVGSTIQVSNSDPILHSTHLYLGNKTAFNLALPMKGVKVKKTLTRPGLYSVRCDPHNWMSGYILILPHRYGTVTGRDGSFRIQGIPPGSYTVKTWHEMLPPASRKIEVRDGKLARLEITLE